MQMHKNANAQKEKAGCKNRLFAKTMSFVLTQDYWQNGNSGMIPHMI